MRQVSRKVTNVLIKGGIILQLYLFDEEDSEEIVSPRLRQMLSHLTKLVELLKKRRIWQNVFKRHPLLVRNRNYINSFGNILGGY